MNSLEARTYRAACKYARKLQKDNYSPEGIVRGLQINFPSVNAHEIMLLLIDLSEA